MVEIEQNYVGMSPDPFVAAQPKTMTAYYGALAGRPRGLHASAPADGDEAA